MPEAFDALFNAGNGEMRDGAAAFERFGKWISHSGTHSF